MTRKQAIKEFKREGMIIPESAVELAIADMEKLERIEQIIKDYDGSTSSMIKQFSEIQKVLEME